MSEAAPAASPTSTPRPLRDKAIERTAGPSAPQGARGLQGRGVEATQASARVAREHRAPVGGVGEGGDGGRVSRGDARGASVGQGPAAHRAVVAPGDREGAVGREREGGDPAHVPAQRVEVSPVGGPDPRAAVVARAHQRRAVAGEREGRHAVLVALEERQGAAVDGAPAVDVAAVGAAVDLAARRHGQRAHAVVVAAKDHPRGVFVGGPAGRASVVRACHQPRVALGRREVPDGRGGDRCARRARARCRWPSDAPRRRRPRGDPPTVVAEGHRVQAAHRARRA